MREPMLKDKTELSKISIDGDSYYKISHSDTLRPFFMSIVSDTNLWMFISSNGGVTAGRTNADGSIFPYYTDDKITEMAEFTGSKSIFRVVRNGVESIWEPFSYRYEGIHKTERHLYKSVYGNKIIFEEINVDLGLTFRYQWNTSNSFGFVKRSTLINNQSDEVKVRVLDGVQNLLPYGVPSDLQNSTSNLVDAYKRSELDKASGLGIFALSAIIVDRAEPSEALRANVAYSLGLDNPEHLLSSLQLNAFRRGEPITEETDVKAEKGAYFVHETISLEGNQQKEWLIIADVNKTHGKIARLIKKIKEDADLYEQVNFKVNQGTTRLIKLVAAADGLQSSADEQRDSRHYSNVLFNIMRGGIFDNNYQVEKWDFEKYLQNANKKLYAETRSMISALPEVFSIDVLRKLASDKGNKALSRLCMEYLPLKFSRRHGDPSRPWNKFSINTRTDDGDKILDYEGNWRDIFQNWEALAVSYPGFVESMIHKFLNASTFDGYNPYRVTKDGFDWETIEPDNPWSYIGYWGDHQIIYLQKFLEILDRVLPGRLQQLFSEEIFVYANVPYRIKKFTEIVKDPKNTILFDEPSDHSIREKRDRVGADGALLSSGKSSMHTVNFLEKILATTLAKMSNFIPEGGIWMNTQRPEWNDANNALVGNGVSMVTLYYLRRFLKFFEVRIGQSSVSEVEISEELLTFFNQLNSVLTANDAVLNGSVSDADRKSILDGLGLSASAYREKIYDQSFSGVKGKLSLVKLKEFVTSCLNYLEHSIRANLREDGLFHAYNLMTYGPDGVKIDYLSEMLEGQVAVLSSGYLGSKKALAALDSMKKSDLFRDDQYSYLLYPNKELPKFMEKNTIPKEAVSRIGLFGDLLAAGDKSILIKDVNGDCHFNGIFKNADDLKAGLGLLSNTSFAAKAEEDKQAILDLFEDMFNHKAFTGRSGTFFGYEGLGSIYWHMVSKLQLAVQECCIKAINQNEEPQIIGGLLEHYYEINEGIGVHKSPSLYGAFPTDPYSHTPFTKGAQQPGMTGQVKEDILSRFGELGVVYTEGNVTFHPTLLRKDEFLEEAKTFKYADVNEEVKKLELVSGSMCYTLCQVPVIYKLGSHNEVTVTYADNEIKLNGLSLGPVISHQVFSRSGEVQSIEVELDPSILK